MDDPFSGLELISSSPDQKNVLNNTTNDNLEAPNDNNDSDIETAVEADEFLILESGDNSETLTHQIGAKYLGFFSSHSLIMKENVLVFLS